MKQFYLAGGSGLALHLGHRFSEDLDFFSPELVDPQRIRELLGKLGRIKIEMEREGTLWAVLQGTKLSFFEYRYPLLERPVEWERVTVAGLKDIACMKLDTIASRGSRRDFVDLYCLLQQGHRVSELLRWFEEKFRGVDFNRGHLLKSLTYFEDAELDPPLQMIQMLPWEKVQAFFIAEASKIVRG